MKDHIAFEMEVRKIIMNIWDPIGINEFVGDHDIADEYDRYIPTICKLLLTQNILGFTNYLSDVEKYIGADIQSYEKHKKIYYTLNKKCRNFVDTINSDK